MTKGESPDSSRMNSIVLRMIEDALASEGVSEIFKAEENSSESLIGILGPDNFYPPSRLLSYFRRQLFLNLLPV